MKLMAIMLVVCLQVSAGASSQTVTYSAKNAKLETVFNVIRQQTGYVFFYKANVLKDAKPVNLDVKNVPIERVLQLCLDNQGLGYTIEDKTIVIAPKEEKKAPAINSGAAIAQEPQVPPNIDVKGRVVNEKGEGVIASVQVKGTTRGVSTNEQGYFELKGMDENAVLVISGVNIETFEVRISGRSDLGNIVVKNKVVQGEEVVVVNTGYQQLKMHQSTGSTVKISNELINRSVSTNIIDRLKGVTSGVLFSDRSSLLGFNIRGRSTLTANTNPLIIIDNFPFDGDLANINPNDVEDITILRDAASASIWGARAGNGVVVITTKKGAFNRKTQVSFNANVTVEEKPDLWAVKEMSTSDVIDVEQFLFTNGAYNSLNFASNRSIAPSAVVDILRKQQAGALTSQQASQQIAQLRTLNNKEDLLEYVYSPSIRQQYALNLSGGGTYNRYYFSTGFDQNKDNIKTNQNKRITLNANNTYSLLNNRLEISTGINFSATELAANHTGTYVRRPYDLIADPNGDPVPYNFYRKEWTDTVGQGLLLDWTLRPLDEIRTANRTQDGINYLLNAAVKYNVLPGLQVSAIYQFNKGQNEQRTLTPLTSIVTRDRINGFSQINYTAKTVTRPIPIGDILAYTDNQYRSHNLRFIAEYRKNFNQVHDLNLIAGAEVKDFESITNGYTLYGYEETTKLSIPVDFISSYKTIYTASSISTISGAPRESGVADNFISMFANGAYNFKGRYTFTGSIRKDESNIFGVKSNQKGVPLWSLGAGWTISKERFFQVKWVDQLRLRLSYGYSGNLDKSLSAYAIIRRSTVALPYQDLSSTLESPPNPQLRWERINITNLATDFSLLRNRISGSFDIWFKKGYDIIGPQPSVPQSGVTTVFGNFCDITASGINLVLNTRIIDRRLKWDNILLVDHQRNKITTYKERSTVLGFHEGYSIDGLYSYRWAGLSNTGEPQGYKNGAISNNHSGILTTDSIGATTVYNGSGTPTWFGSFRNELSWKGFRLSFNITYKLGYVFRAQTINYSNLLTSPIGHSDYSKRWKTAGDEAMTYVPAFIYPFNANADQFFKDASVNVLRGDHIRLQDLRLDYTLATNNRSGLPFKNATIYIYANNIAMLWKANDRDIDPEFQQLPAQRIIAVGLNVGF